MAYDITNAIMDTFIDYVPGYINEGLLPDDPDWLETIEKGPLQDDPTVRATYLIIEPDYEVDGDGYRQPVGSIRKNKLRHAETAPQHEIGRGAVMVNYFRIGGWTPRSSSKAELYETGGKFARRLERAVQQIARDVLPQGVTTDDELESTKGLLQMFNLNGTEMKPKGGESEWYAVVYVKFAVYSVVEYAYWR